MTQDEHRKRHQLLHQMLDELIADFLTCNRGKGLSTTLRELMEWSQGQTVSPTPTEGQNVN